MNDLYFLLIILFLGACQASPKESVESNPDDPLTRPVLQDSTEVKETEKERAAIDTAAFKWEGQTILRHREGRAMLLCDLNKDGREDLVFIGAEEGPNDEVGKTPVTKLFLLMQNEAGQLEFAAETGDLGYDAYTGVSAVSLSMKNGVLSYLQQAMRNEVELKFRYEPKYRDFMLIGLEATFYGSAGYGPSHTRINYITGKRIRESTKWSDDGEELKSLPDEIDEVSKVLKTLSAMNQETIYDDV